MRTSGAVINLEKQQDKKDGQRLDEIKQNITYTFITLLSFGSLFPLTPVLLAWLSIQCLLVYYQAVYLDDTRRCVFKDKHGEIQPICNASGQPIANYLTLSESQSSGDMFRYNAKTSTYSPQQGPLVDGTKAKHFQQAQSTLRKTSEPSQENKYFRRHNNHAKASWLFMSIMPMLEFAVRPLVKVINILLLEVSAIEMCDNLYKTGSVNAMPSVQPKMTDRNGSNGVKKKAFIAKKHNKVLLQKVLSYTMSLAYISVCATIQSIFWLLDKIAEILHAFKFYRHCHWLLEISSQIIYWASAGVVLYQYFVTPSVPSMIMAACMAFVMIEKYKLVPASMRERLEQLRFIMPNIHLMFSLISGALGKNFLPAGNVITKLWAIVDLGLSLFFLITQTLGYVISKTGKMIVALLTSGITRVSGLINLAIEAHKRYKNNRKLSKLDKTGSQFLVDHVLASFYTITRSSQAKQNQSSTTEVELWPEHLNTYKGDIKATSRAWKELSQDFMCLDEHIKTLTQHAYSSRIDQLSSTLSLNPAFFDNRSSGSLNTEDQSIPTQINAARMADFLTESSQADIRLWEDFCKSYNDVQTENDIEKSVIDALSMVVEVISTPY